MDEVTQFLEATLRPLVLVFTVSNLAAMGLRTQLPAVLQELRNKRAILLIFLWGWVLGPCLALLITKVLPLEEPYAVVVVLASLAPCAPILQLVVGTARCDMGFAGAFVPLVTVGTVILMPLLAPVLIQGLTLSLAALAKPLVLTILLPLVVAAAIRHLAGTLAVRILPACKALAMLSTLGCLVWCLGLYGADMLQLAGDLAFLAMNLFMVAMGVITYRYSIGLTRNQRSVMALGLGAQNGVAMFAAAIAIPNADPRILVMVVMWILWETVLSLLGARVLARLAAGNPGTVAASR